MNMNAQAYLTLCKPKVVALMLLSSIVGMILAPGLTSHKEEALLGLLGIALAASAGAVINHLIDRHFDITMKRTHKRPLPQGHILPQNALIFGLLLGLLGTLILALTVNTTAALLTLVTMIGYAVIYTYYLKHATPQNIVIGGLSGALPPLLGWTCITGHISPEPLLLVLIIFAWTPPHFWALAIDRIEDYRAAKIPMLPVTHGIQYTKLQMTLYTILTIVITYIPVLINMFGLFYVITTSLLNARFLFLTIQCQYSTNPKLPKKLFIFSIQYLMLLFIIMIIDHLITHVLYAS